MITKEQVQHIAKLARIELSDKELERFEKDFAAILEYFAVLDKIDAKGVEPMTHAGTAQNVTRKDVVSGCSMETRAKLVAMSPEEKDGYLKVRSIL